MDTNVTCSGLLFNEWQQIHHPRVLVMCRFVHVGTHDCVFAPENDLFARLRVRDDVTLTLLFAYIMYLYILIAFLSGESILPGLETGK